ncbi:hypothetical protein SCLCIDRAFT_1219593 [Scleroderma citrinum Foug A]|uniref:Hydrophobin n=1 Tax=Scleroderma citrinum Foug A TaxID=1036808 RepID=A0A0C3DMJ7_9AGAM|nr:hypothetical protein SCLCIDRAFT_1219593 [Scleroderma citrinum Foug A]
MFTRKSALLLPAVALCFLIAAASEPVVRGDDSGVSNRCITDSQCYNQIYEVRARPLHVLAFSLPEMTIDQCTLHSLNNPTNINYLEGLLAAVLEIGVDGLLGLECSPVSIHGVGMGTSSAARPPFSTAWSTLVA